MDLKTIKTKIKEYFKTMSKKQAINWILSILALICAIIITFQIEITGSLDPKYAGWVSFAAMLALWFVKNKEINEYMAKNSTIKETVNDVINTGQDLLTFILTNMGKPDEEIQELNSKIDTFQDNLLTAKVTVEEMIPDSTETITEK